VNKYSNKFSLRIDIDTSLGLAHGMPRMLDLFAQFGIAANIFVVMGPDRNFNVMRSHYGFLKAAYAFRKGLPKRVAGSNPEVIRRLCEGPHFLSPHGWDHQRYSLMRLSREEKHGEFERAVGEFEKLFGLKPLSYLFPCDLIDEDGIAFAKEHDMNYLSYNSHSFNELDPHWTDGIFYLPVFPFYDGDMMFRGDTEAKVLKLYKSYVDLCLKSGTICSIAMHPCQIGSKDSYLEIVGELLAYVQKMGMETLRIDQLSSL